MGSYERKAKRKNNNKNKKMAEKELLKKVELFGSLSDKCLTCEKPFDKLNREQVMTWNVVVRQREEKVNLYCPACWNTAMNIIKEYNEKKGEN